MKKNILILGLIITTQLVAKAQQQINFVTATDYTALKKLPITQRNTFAKSIYTPSNNLLNKDYKYYMHKRKNALTTGWITLGAGIIFSGVGILMASKSTSQNAGSTGGVLTIAGAVSGIVSIPFMIMANVYKQKARLQISSQQTSFCAPFNFSKSITSVTLAIQLGK
jgi:hypothetical protein